MFHIKFYLVVVSVALRYAKSPVVFLRDRRKSDTRYANAAHFIDSWIVIII